MSVKVKICGITSVDDAKAAVDAGADAIGLMFYEPSPRNLSLKVATGIASSLPPFITRVGVFVNAAKDVVHEAAQACGLDALQLHGDEPPEYCRQFTTRVIKAFRIRDAASLVALKQYSSFTWLLDSFTPGQQGGTGATFNWDLAVQAKSAGVPIILAGGLTPENVTEAIAQVQPYAVDVSSGVESAPGRKDARKMRAFVAAAKK